MARKHEFTSNGRVYQVSLVTNEIKDAWEKTLFRRAKDCAREMKDMLSPDEYADLLKRLANDYSSGAYAFESENSVAMLQNQQGVITLCSLLFGVDRSEMINIMVDNTQEVASLMETILRESFPDNVWAKAEAYDESSRAEAKKA